MSESPNQSGAGKPDGDQQQSALVPAEPGKLEKVAPGAIRVLSGMVADALALTAKHLPPKRTISILVGGSMDFLADLLRIAVPHFDPRLQADVVYCERMEEFVTALEQRRFDLCVLDLYFGHNPVLQLAQTPQLNGEIRAKVTELRNANAWVRRTDFLILRYLYWLHGIPVIVVDTWGSPAGTDLLVKEAGGYALFDMPFTIEPFSKCLRDLINEPRIVILGDDSAWLDGHRSDIQHYFKNVFVTTFQDGSAALKELTRSPPSLFIVELRGKAASGAETLAILAERKPEYPVLLLNWAADPKAVKRARVIARSIQKQIYFDTGNSRSLPVAEFYGEVSKAIGIKPDLTSLSKRHPLIYILDDEECLLEMVVLALKSLGCSVRAFGNPKQFLEALTIAEIGANLIITNLNMAEMNGFQVIEQVTQIMPRTKVLMMSGMADERVLRSAHEMGAEFLAKPFTIDELVNTVGSLLGYPLASHE